MTMKPFSSFLIENASELPPSIDHWKKTGEQLGSNPGGIYHNEHGEKHYVKFYHNPEQAKQEVASGHIHRLMGVNTATHAFLVHHQGRLGVAAKWNEGLKDTHISDLTDKLSHKEAGHFGRMYHAAVLTKNWDIVGHPPYNIMKHEKTGELHSIDHGGSFHFRAMGGPKEYGGDANELHSLRNPTLPVGQVLNHVFSKHPHAEREGLQATHDLAYNDVHRIFREVGLHNHKELADTLWQRRSNILKHYSK